MNTSEIDLLFTESALEAIIREESAFDSIAGKNKNLIVLFGAGELGKRTLEGLRKEWIEPVAFADNNPKLWGRFVSGVEVFSPEEAAKRFGKSAVFVITIWYPSKVNRMSNVITQLKDLGCEHVVPFQVLYWKYPKRFLPYLCLEAPHRLVQEADEIRTVFSLLSDDISRYEYISQLKCRLYADWHGLSEPMEEEQYFPEDIFTLLDNEIFVDCGAYDGGTIKPLLEKKGLKFGNIIALEPDPSNFYRLNKYIGTLDEEYRKKIKAYPYTIGDKHSRVCFDATGSTGARVSDAGKMQIDCIPLDKIPGDQIPTYIKMDIKGAELQVLEGAAGVIGKHHPILGICLYHKWNDLWKLPLKIKELYSGYRLYLRAYYNDCFELVCYAVPEERLKKICE